MKRKPTVKKGSRKRINKQVEGDTSKTHKLEDIDPEEVSLVRRGANRLKFAVVKEEKETPLKKAKSDLLEAALAYVKADTEDEESSFDELETALKACMPKGKKKKPEKEAENDVQKTEAVSKEDIEKHIGDAIIEGVKGFAKETDLKALVEIVKSIAGTAEQSRKSLTAAYKRISVLESGTNNQISKTNEIVKSNNKNSDDNWPAFNLNSNE